MATQWRGLQAPGKQEETKNSRSSSTTAAPTTSGRRPTSTRTTSSSWIVALSVHPDEPDDMKELELQQGDLVEVYNDNGTTRRWPIRRRPPGQTNLHAVRQPDGRPGQRRLAGVNELIIPNYKQTWGRHPQDRLGAGRGAGHELQVLGIQNLTKTNSARAPPRPRSSNPWDWLKPQSGPGRQFRHGNLEPTMRLACSVHAPLLLESNFQPSMRTAWRINWAIGMRGSSSLCGPLWTGDRIHSCVGHGSLLLDFRCAYCMAEEMTFLPRRELLTLEELDRLCSAFIEMGTRKEYGLPAESPSSAATSWSCSARCRGISRRERLKRSH